ncbi:MAG: XRE family transcriptional regulator, partial [Caldilineae bacterium]
MHFGLWVRRQREKQGLDLQSLAKQARLNASSISRIENCSLNPTIETAVQLLRALGATPLDVYLALTGKEKADLAGARLQGTLRNAPTREDVIAFEQFARE